MSTIVGTTGSDNLTGDNGDDRIFGRGGDDQINASGGNNFIQTQDGNDDISAGDGNDEIQAGRGDNYIQAGNGRNKIFAGWGNDTILSGSGDDEIDAGDGDNSIDAGDGRNRIHAGRGNDRIQTGADDDEVNAGDGNNHINVGEGRNRVQSSQGDDEISAGSGDDFIQAGDGNNTVDAGDGRNFVKTGRGDDYVSSGSGDDVIDAGEGTNSVDAGAGNDQITTGNGSDRVFGGAGNDRIFTHGGADEIEAGSGNDEVFAGQGNDRVVHSLADSLGDSDRYFGDGGWDTLVLEVTAEEAANPALLADLGRFEVWLANGSQGGFRFSSFNLEVYSFEAVEYIAPVVADDDAFTTDEDTSLVANVLVNDVDLLRADNSALTISQISGLDSEDGQAAISTDGRTIHFTPGARFQSLSVGDSAEVAFSYSVGDDQGFVDTAQMTVTIEGRNDDPQANDDPDAVLDNGALFSTDEDTAFTTGNVLVNDSDPDAGDVISVQSIETTGTQGDVVQNDDGTFTYDPSGQFEALAQGDTATDAFSYTVSDGRGGADTADVEITINGVNDAPTGSGASLSAQEDGVPVTTGVLTGDVDSDDDPSSLNYIITQDPAEGAASSNGDGTFTFDPQDDFQDLSFGETREVSFAYEATDSHGQSSGEYTVVVEVAGANDVPIAVDDSFGGSVVAGLVVADLNVPGTANPWLSGVPGGVSDGPDSAPQQAGVFAASVTGGSVLTFEATGGARHNSANPLSPVDGAVEHPDQQHHNGALNGMSNVTAPLSALMGVFLSDDDPRLASAPGALDFTSSGLGTQFTTLSPELQQVFFIGDGLDGGAVAQHFVVPDGATRLFLGSMDGTQWSNNRGGFTVAISASGEDTPISEDGPAVSLDLTANDTDPDSSDDLEISDLDLTGTLGALSIAPDADHVLYDPNGKFEALAVGDTATDSFSYTVSDGHGGSDTAIVNVTVKGENDTPTAMSAVLLAEEGGDAVTTGVLADDVDSDDDAASLTYVITQDPAEGSVIANGDGTFTFDPGGDFQDLEEGETREVIFKYTATDFHGAVSPEQSVTVTVTGVEAAVTEAKNDTAHVIEHSEIVIPASALFTNDTDINGTGLDIIAVSATSAQGVTLSFTSGSVTYNAGQLTTLLAAGQTLSDSFSYTIEDGAGATASATVSVVIDGVNDLPVLNGSIEAQTVSEGGELTFSFPENLFVDNDEAGAITYSAELQDGNPLPSWLAYNQTARSFTGSPGTDDAGLYRIEITAAEPDGQSGTYGFTLTVLDGDVIDGTPDPDNLEGTINGDYIRGLASNDTIQGLPGADVIEGNDGNDTLRGGPGDDVLNGDDGNDSLYGADGDDLLDGGPGRDRLYGGDGDDELRGGTDTEQNYFRGDDGADTYYGGDGDETFYLYDDETGTVETVFAGGGNDAISYVGYRAADIIDAGAGDDRIGLYTRYSGSLPIITLGAGRDTIYFEDYFDIHPSYWATVTDFLPGVGGDYLNIFRILNDKLSGWDGSINPFDGFNAGFLQLVQDGSDALFQVDVNGGADNFVTVIRFQNVSVSSFIPDNFLPPYPVDGAPPAGQTITGDSSSDTLEGTIGADVINGLEGNDTLHGLPGDDELNGGDDNDELRGGPGDDVLNGDDGNDSLYGADGDDLLDGGPGRDRLYGGDGDDELRGGTDTEQNYFRGDDGADTYYGGDGDETFYLYDDETGTVETVFAGGGNDAISYVGYRAADIIDAGAGDDRIGLYTRYSGSLPIITLGAGRDTIYFEDYFDIHPSYWATVTDFLPGVGGDYLNIFRILNDKLSGWDGSINPFDGFNAGFLQLVQDGSDALFQVDVNGGADNFVTVIRFQNVSVSSFIPDNFLPPYPVDGAPPAGQTITGDSSSDTLEGTIGADVINGLEGNDTLHGLPGDDELNGGDDNDELRGGPGDDVLNGDDGNDSLYGEDGDDLLDGGPGRDRLYGGDGDDELRGGTDTEQNYFRGDDGADTYYGGDGDETFYLYDDETGTVETVFAGGGNDAISYVGYRAADIIDAGAGDDRIGLYTRYSGSLPIITLGAGRDTIYFEDYFDIHPSYWATVTDFLPGVGGDYLNIFRILNDKLSGWDGISNPFASGHMRMAQDGPDTLFQVDTNGGGDSYTTVLVLQGVLRGDLSRENFDPDFPPDGSGIFGVTHNGGSGMDSLTGSHGDDIISGNAGEDTLWGTNGNDVIDGGTENDAIDGGFGRDRIIGGEGNDTLTGGGGIDTFAFDTSSGSDTITDFSTDPLERDLVEISGGIYGSGAAALAAATQNGFNVTLALSGGDVLTLENVLLADLVEEQFLIS